MPRKVTMETVDEQLARALARVEKLKKQKEKMEAKEQKDGLFAVQKAVVEWNCSLKTPYKWGELAPVVAKALEGLKAPKITDAVKDSNGK